MTAQQVGIRVGEVRSEGSATGIIGNAEVRPVGDTDIDFGRNIGGIAASECVRGHEAYVVSARGRENVRRILLIGCSSVAEVPEPAGGLGVVGKLESRSRITTGSKGGLDGGIRLGEDRDVGVFDFHILATEAVGRDQGHRKDTRHRIAVCRIALGGRGTVAEVPEVTDSAGRKVAKGIAVVVETGRTYRRGEVGRGLTYHRDIVHAGQRIAVAGTIDRHKADPRSSFI